MDSLPAYRRHEISYKVAESTNSVVFDQAENGLDIQRGLLGEADASANVGSRYRAHVRGMPEGRLCHAQNRSERPDEEYASKSLREDKPPY